MKLKKYKNKKNYIKYIPIMITIVVVCLTIGFSAFEEQMLVTDLVADIRLKQDIRVTNARVDNVSLNTVSQSLDYNKSNISDTVTLPNSDSRITYTVEITNIENSEMGIYDLTLSNSNLDYTIDNYTKKDKLCDDNNNLKCNLGSKSTLQITIFYKENMYDSNNLDQNFALNFSFKQMHQITYEIPGSNQSSIMDGETLEVNFGENALDRITVKIGGVRLNTSEYTYENGILIVSNVNDNVQIEKYTTDPSCFVSNIEAQINDYICEEKDVVIPDNLMLAINGEGQEYKVNTIGANAFQEKELTSVIISDDIIDIGNSAFVRNKLSSVSIGNSVQNIDKYAFQFNNLTALSLPNSVKTLGQSAFSQNSLSSVDLGDGVTSIGHAAFWDNLLTTINFPSSLITIGTYSFQSNQLTTVNIPNNVTIIADGAFISNKITSLTIGTGVQSIGSHAFRYNSLTSVIIPGNVKTLGQSAFSQNKLNSVTLTNGIISIGHAAFWENQLTSVSIPNSVTNVGPYSFRNNSLTSVYIGNGVKTIGEYAFMENQISSMRINAKKSEVTLDRGAFDGVTGTVCWLGDNPTCGN